jgi:hypothetical protein
MPRRGIRLYSAPMSRVVVYLNGGRFELASGHAAEDVLRQLSSPRGDRLRFTLSHGGSVDFGITPGLAWAVEQLPDDSAT